MPVSSYMCGQNSFQVPWHMVLDPTASTKALMSVDRCQIVLVEGDIQLSGVLFSHISDIILPQRTYFLMI